MSSAIFQDVARYLDELKSGKLLLTLDWEQWLGIDPPYAEARYSKSPVTARFQRNGYDWDIHGSLYRPETEADGSVAAVIFHGGAGSEWAMDETPDGRPSIASILASQGFKVLALTYPGHYPPGGVWAAAIEDRLPIYLLDTELAREETLDRTLKCTFNVILQGAAQLVDEHLAGRRILAFGHSTGGPMAAHLHRFSHETRVVGIIGYGSGGPDGWRKEWRETTGAEPEKEFPLDLISRRSAESFRNAGYEDPADLCPWINAEAFFARTANLRSHFKTGLCDNQHRAAVGMLKSSASRTGLPEAEYLDHLQDPDPAWLRSIGVLLVVGENDRGHWLRGDHPEHKREMFMARKYAGYSDRTHVVVIPRYGHFGYASLYNEKIVYLWLWAHRQGYFDDSGGPLSGVA